MSYQERVATSAVYEQFVEIEEAAPMDPSTLSAVLLQIAGHVKPKTLQAPTWPQGADEEKRCLWRGSAPPWFDGARANGGSVN